MYATGAAPVTNVLHTMEMMRGADEQISVTF